MARALLKLFPSGSLVHDLSPSYTHIATTFLFSIHNLVADSVSCLIYLPGVLLCPCICLGSSLPWLALPQLPCGVAEECSHELRDSKADIDSHAM